MKKYSKEEICNIVTELLAEGHEGDYWDYKCEWPANNKKSDLLKDIISFANTMHPNDCFIIYGANDDGSPHAMHNNRYKQTDIDDLLLDSKIKWAEENRPEVILQTITIDKNDYDVLIVCNSDRTPFYLHENYSQGINGTTLHRWVIYTRHCDSNRIATPFIVEELWKKRFHLLQPVYTQFIEEMKHPDNWKKGDEDSFHHIYRPEFTFQDKKDSELSSFKEYYVMLYPDKNAYKQIYRCNYYGTVLREFRFIIMDGCRWYCPYPRIDLIPFVSKRYFYFLKTSDEMIVYHFVNREATCSYSPFDIMSQYIPFFFDQNERKTFNAWLQDKKELFDSACSDIKTQYFPFSDKSLVEDAIIGKAIVKMFNRFKSNQ